jgi:NAD(P)H-flavin reductase
LRGPFGSSWPVEQAVGRDLVLVAGGIGLAPLRPVLYEVLRNRKKFGRVTLLYGARTPDDLLYREEFSRTRRDLDVGVTVDRAIGAWEGHIGVVTTLIPAARFEPKTAIAMICGPEVMMRFTIRALCERGMTRDRVYISMERNMKCGVGFCGHCQYGPKFICKDGPVFRYDQIEDLFRIREL